MVSGSGPRLDGFISVRSVVDVPITLPHPSRPLARRLHRGLLSRRLPRAAPMNTDWLWRRYHSAADRIRSALTWVNLCESV